MSTIEEILASMADEDVAASVEDLLVIDQNTRQINIPGSELILGVESDTHSERKWFLCPRMVGNELDLASCFFRVNFRNANGDIDSYLVDDVTVVDDNLLFSWELSRKVTLYQGQVKFVVCAARPGGNGVASVEWNTTQASGMVLVGLEPDSTMVENQTADVIAQLLGVVAAQTDAVTAEGATQIKAVQNAADASTDAAKAEIEAKGTNTLDSIPDDYTALSEAVDAVTRNAAPGIVCSAEGTSVVVSDASDNHIQNIRIFGKSTQDGTPTPEAPVEIKSVEKPVVTVCGKNLAPETTVEFEKHYYMPLGMAYPAGTYSFSAVIESTDTDDEKSSVMLYIGETEVVKSVLVSRSSDGERIGFTVTVAVPFDRIRFYASTGWSISDGDTAKFTDIMFERGGTISEYEPYNGGLLEITHTLPGIPVTSGGNYTDSDGQQWICDEVDLERGVYVRRVGVIEGYSAETIGGPYLSSTGSLTRGAAVQYVLATPIETPLTETEIAAYRALHTNKPNTTVLNDAGAHMVVDYVADTKLYIDNKIAALVTGA
jgi:hypothetical protein